MISLPEINYNLLLSHVAYYPIFRFFVKIRKFFRRVGTKKPSSRKHYEFSLPIENSLKGRSIFGEMLLTTAEFTTAN